MQDAWQGAQGFAPSVSPEVSRKRLGAAFPNLFEAPRPADLGAFEADLKAGVDAHYENALASAEKSLQAAMAFAFAEPAALASASRDLLTRLADASLIRFRNALRMKTDRARAVAELERFMRRFPGLAITPGDHPPEAENEWKEARKRVLADSGSLTLAVHPVELERSGCDLLVNGVATERLGGAPVALPRGDYLVQARCGGSASWPQKITVGARPASLTFPVRAMGAARGHPESGGLVLVAPEEGDAAALVAAVSHAAGFEGAAVVRLTKDRLEVGRQDPGLGAPTREAVARLKGGGFQSWQAAGGPPAVTSSEEGRPAGFGPWPWVAGGVGAAGVTAGLVLNLMYVDAHGAGEVESLDGLKSGALVGYIGGGALLATGVVLYLLDASAEAEAVSGQAPAGSPGAFTVRF